MAEHQEPIQSAETSVVNKSEQQMNPPPVASKPKRGNASGRNGVNEHGVPVTNWDNPDNDPNKRKHVGEDPTGATNKLKGEK